ncbi:hypothetical protein ACFO0S_08015 [Chryseomicrobium palamuruense]|uniref:Lipoprotein n=1 Tax=Chryseomicrobium palamuruense TaxID=682973 RepID=A0ABV8UUX4_9BACL
MKKILMLCMLFLVLFGCTNPFEETVRDSLPGLLEEAVLSPDNEMIHLESVGNRRAVAVLVEPNEMQSTYHVAVIERISPNWKMVEIINVSDVRVNAGVQLDHLGAGIATDTSLEESTYVTLPEEGRYLWYTYR